jgi:hypothetical protein
MGVLVVAIESLARLLALGLAELWDLLTGRAG